MIDQLIALVKAGNFFGLAFVVLTLLQTWTQPTSGFPLTVPERFQPLVAAVLGQAYAVLLVLAAHQSWGVAVAHGVLATLLVLLTSHAIWESDNAPAWVKALAFIIKEAEGGAGGGGDSAKKKGLVSIAGAAMLALSVMLSGCFSQKAAKVVSDIGTDVACVFGHDDGTITPLQIAEACAIDGEQTVVDILAEKHKAEAKKLAASHCASTP